MPQWGPGSLAPVGLRALGRFIDTILTTAPLVIVALAAHWVKTKGSNVDLRDVPLWAPFANQALAFAYETIMVALLGRTVGKLLTGTRVERGDGTLPSWTQSAIRIGLPSLAWVIPWVGGGLLAAVIYLTAIFNPMRRGIHDRAAGTLVVMAGRHR